MSALLRRRVPQVIGAYLATSWIFLEFTSWTVNQYQLSPALSNFVVTALLLLVPAVALLAWRHGAPGDDGWTKTDAAIIGLTVLFAGGVLTSVFRGQELGAATTVRMLEDEHGRTVERAIPKASFRRRIVVWPFDNPAGDAGLHGLQMGMADALETDLDQDLFVSTPSVIGDSENEAAERIRAIGYALPIAIPLALKKDITEGTGAERFLEADLSALPGDTLSVTTRLYDAKTAGRVATHTYIGTDPLEIIDRMSVDVRRDLGVPDWQVEASMDLPASQITTASREALSLYGEAWWALFQSDWEAAGSLAREAAFLDPEFALAHALASYSSIFLGNQSAAREEMARAMANAHRLPEPWRLSLRMFDQLFYEPDLEAAIRTGTYWAELYPDDMQAHWMLADVYLNMGAGEEQIAELRYILAMEPENTRALRGVAETFRYISEPDSALAYYRLLAELRPSDVRVLLDVAAALSEDLVRFDEAAAELDRARVVNPQDPEVTTRLARLNMRRGRFAEARANLDEAARLTRTAEERFAVASAEESYFYLLGRYGELKAAYARGVEAAGQHLAPVMANQEVPTSELILHAAEWDADRVAFALAQLDSMKASVEAPWNLLSDIPAIPIHLDAGDVLSARSALQSFRALNDLFGEAPSRRGMILYYEGRIAELEDGNCERSLELYRQTVEVYGAMTRNRPSLARCLTALELWDEASAQVEWLLDRYPGYPAYHLLAARLAAARGSTADAIVELGIALDVWSEADDDYQPAAEARQLLADLRSEIR